MVQYEDYLKVQRPGVSASFKGTTLTTPCVDAKGNEGKITTTVARDVPSGDPDDVEHAIANETMVKVSETFKREDGRNVSRKKEVRGVFQAAALGHPGAQASVRKIMEENRKAAQAKRDESDRKARLEAERVERERIEKEAAELAELEKATAPAGTSENAQS